MDPLAHTYGDVFDTFTCAWRVQSVPNLRRCQFSGNGLLGSIDPE